MAGNFAEASGEVAALRQEIERLRARLQAREDGLDLEAIFPAMPALLFLFGPDDRFLDFRAGFRVFAPPEAFLGRRVDEVMPPPIGEQAREALARARAKGKPIELEYVLPEPDGEHHYSCLILPLRAGRAAALCTDVSDRRRAEEALRRSEERLRFASEAATDVVWDWNLVDDTIFLPRWAEAYGYPPGAAPRTGVEFAPYVHPDDMPAFDEAMRLAITGERDTVEFEHRIRAGTGEWRWMLAHARVVARDAQGKATRLVGACSDITERKLLLAKLQMADRMASVGTLAAGVAHEINNPLAYVVGNVGYVIEKLEALEQDRGERPGGAPAPQAIATECIKVLREAEGGAERVRQIVRDLKLFSRPDDEQRTPVSLSRVVEAALNLAEADIRYRARLERKLAVVPTVLANEARLSQVFLNLLVNAAQAIPEGDPDRNQITVETRVGSGGRIVAEVRDTGLGIPPEIRARIFDPFFTTKAVGGGTGLGLTICHGIVSALGGSIEVESEVGRGSTFRVSLPETTVADRPAEKKVMLQAPRRARILVVDDEPMMCRALARMLGSEHETLSTTDPRDAVRRIESGERFDLVLSDVAMSGMTGIELYGRLAKTAPELAERMLFMTGGALTPAAAVFLDGRSDRVLEKPLTADLVRSAVARALQP
jgi:PAS domain S-box-containing protein